MGLQAATHMFSTVLQQGKLSEQITSEQLKDEQRLSALLQDEKASLQSKQVKPPGGICACCEGSPCEEGGSCTHFLLLTYYVLYRPAADFLNKPKYISLDRTPLSRLFSGIRGRETCCLI